MNAISSAPSLLLTIAERAAAGRARRGRLPRGAHAAWPPPPAERDPMALLQHADRSRIAALLPLRYQRMRANPFAFLRGAAAVMAADLGGQPDSGLRVQACGDCHLANFGAYASPEGTPVFDINDFDETLPAPFEWDVKRLAVSLMLAARARGADEPVGQALARRAARAYRRHMLMLADLPPLDAWRSRVDLRDAIRGIEDHASRRHERHRLRAAVAAGGRAYAGLIGPDGLHLPQRPPAVFRIGPQEATAHSAFAAYLDSLAEERRVLVARYRLRDVAFKAVGVGSVGTFCAIGLFTTGDGDPLLLQLKEAQESVLAPYAGASLYPHQGQRIVTGQRMMQAVTDVFLGYAQGGPDGRFFYVRQLKDPRLASIGTEMEAGALHGYAKLCGKTLARAHARSGDAAAIAGYLGHGAGFDRAIAAFSSAYAAQTEADHAAFTAAIQGGRIAVAK